MKPPTWCEVLLLGHRDRSTVPSVYNPSNAPTGSESLCTDPNPVIPLICLLLWNEVSTGDCRYGGKFREDVLLCALASSLHIASNGRELLSDKALRITHPQPSPGQLESVTAPPSRLYGLVLA